jgi:glycosyltransferase involved in cell wall biosynthesis
MRIYSCVTNDTVTDGRVNRIALTLQGFPADVCVVGISWRGCLPIKENRYRTHRMRLLFRKGPCFYAEYNMRLFFYLLFRKADVLIANDLDTLTAVFLVSRIRRMPVVYDSHEYFTELPELVNRKATRKIWVWLEKMMLPHIKHAFTVSDSIAASYKQQYGIDMVVVRNLPFRMEKKPEPVVKLRRGDEKLILYQGSLNKGRGLELAIKALQFLRNARFIIAGTGYLETALRKMVCDSGLDDRVAFTGRIPAEELSQLTCQCDLGISLEEDLGLNYVYALPNKLFDYIQARVPVLVSDLPEMSRIVSNYDIGRTIHAGNPESLACVFREMLEDGPVRQQWLYNLEKASFELCWEREKEKLLTVYQQVITKKLH